MRIGSLFTGHGGLDEGVRRVLGGTVAWVSDIDKGACKLLAHRYPCGEPEYDGPHVHISPRRARHYRQDKR